MFEYTKKFLDAKVLNRIPPKAEYIPKRSMVIKNKKRKNHKKGE